jgi:hypothetical protein
MQSGLFINFARDAQTPWAFSRDHAFKNQASGAIEATLYRYGARYEAHPPRGAM